MKRNLILAAALAVAVCLSVTACKQKEQAREPAKDTAVSGETLFKQYCSPCHPNGENNVNPKKTLHQKDLQANGVNTENDIVGKMRNPGPGMTKFDENTIPDKDAKAIAEYIMKTFK